MCARVISLLSTLFFLPSQILVSLEMMLLLFFAVDSAIQLIWLHPRTFFTTKRSIIKVFILVVLFTDALVVACRGEVHLRVLRCLRPYYFIDCHVTSGVRRSVFLKEGEGGGWAYPTTSACISRRNGKWKGKTM